MTRAYAWSFAPTTPAMMVARDMARSGGGTCAGASGICGLASMLDMDRDGNPLDGIMSMVRGQRG